MKAKVLLFSMALTTALLLSAGVAFAALTYGNGVYTNLCGSNDFANFYGCQAWCDPANGFCSTINPANSQSQYWVYRWSCPNTQASKCGDNPELLTPTDALKYLRVDRDISGSPTACNSTVQLDVFNIFCGAPDAQGHFDQWQCAPSPGVVDPNLMGYMVWYSGQCGGQTPPPACQPSLNAHNPNPVNGQTNVSLQPSFSWSWDCDPSWVKWVDVFIWNCNPNGGAGCSLSKPLSFAHLGPGATSATLSQFQNLPSLTASTNYWWEVVPNSNPTVNNVWTFSTLSCPATSTTDSSVSLTPSGPWQSSLSVTGTTGVFVKGNNRGGVSPVNVSVNLGITQSAANNTPVQVGDTNGLKLGSHRVVSYTGVSDNFCGIPATYSCQAAPPDIIPGTPNAGDPTHVNWSLGPNQFGVDHCGGDYPNNNQIGVSLYSGSDPSTGTLLGSCPTISGDSASTTQNCAIGYTGTFTNGQNLSYRFTGNNNTGLPCNASNSVNCTIKDISFQYNALASAWFQTANGAVYAEGNIKSTVPTVPLQCSTPASCYFNINPEAPGYPGVVSYGSSSAPDFGGRLSTKNWLANLNYQIRPPTYNDLIRQVPVTPEPVSDGDHLTGKVNSGGTTGGSDALYLIYDNGSATDSTDLTIGDLNVNNNKVVLYVPQSNSGHIVKITGNIKITPGVGFFGLITSRPVQIGGSDPHLNNNITEVDGLIFTDAGGAAFTTEKNGDPTDKNLKQLTVTGAVVATNGDISLNRTLNLNDNSDHPAEQFNFDPSMIFTMPRGLRRLQYQINEVPASSQQ